MINPGKRPRTSKIQFLRVGLEARVSHLQESNQTLTQLSTETDDFLALVKDFRSVKARRNFLIQKIDNALSQAILELRSFEQEQIRPSLRDRFKALQDLVKAHCGLNYTKSEPESESGDEETLVKKREGQDPVFLVRPANN